MTAQGVEPPGPGDDDVFGSIVERTARGIAGEVGRLITTGILPADTRLPTVRELADRLGVSPATISEAWQMLRHAGMLDTRGRNGTRVIQPKGRAKGVGRYGRVAGIGKDLPLNLATGTPDPGLLPDIFPLLKEIDLTTSVIDYLAPPVIDSLREHLLTEWPFQPGSLTVVNGAMDGLARVSAEVVPYGSPVAIEDPTFPPLIDALEQLGAKLLPIRLDSEGPLATDMAEVLEARPVAFFLQPRAHNPTGSSISQERAQHIARLLAGSDTIVVENDHAGGIAATPVVSLGRWLPDRTVRILGFSKSHGPDLRLAAVGGTADVVDTLVGNRVSGPGWSSRLLQRILLALLTNPDSQATVDRAREIYARRRAALVHALAKHDLETSCHDGINLWVPVADESQALVTLAAHGVAAAPGSPFCVIEDSDDHIRITVGLVEEGEADAIAAILANAARLEVPIRRV